MTIVAGFKCSDGILLASDTLYSGAHQRQHGRKLWILHEDDPVVVFGGAAMSVAALTRARDEIKQKIRRGDSVQRTLDKIDTALRKVNDKFGSPEWPDVQAVVVIRTDGQNLLFQNAPQKIALSPVDLPSVSVGGAYSLADYFSESLFREGMSLKWAKIVAAHLVSNCKRYASGYCGGDTNFVEVPNTGPAVFTDDQSQISKFEAHLAEIGEALKIVLPNINDPNASELSLQHRLDMLTKAIHTARGLAVAVIAPEATIIQDGPVVTKLEP